MSAYLLINVIVEEGVDYYYIKYCPSYQHYVVRPNESDEVICDQNSVVLVYLMQGCTILAFFKQNNARAPLQCNTRYVYH